jgi:ParB family chromosome partitioning protein
MARKIFEKAGLIPGLQASPKPAGGGAAAAEPAKAKTAPGTMMGFLTAQSGAVQEAEALRARVKSLEQDAPLRKIDPSMIRPSKWANRHEASFLTAEFQELKAEIAAAGGNVQPIKVRPVLVLNGSTPPGETSFEL